MEMKAVLFEECLSIIAQEWLPKSWMEWEHLINLWDYIGSSN
jgi:hypothetical protein